VAAFARLIGFAASLLVAAGAGLLAASMLVDQLRNPGQPLAFAVLVMLAAASAAAAWRLRLPAWRGGSRWRLPPARSLLRVFSLGVITHPVGLAGWTLALGAVLLWPPIGPRVLTTLAVFMAYVLAATATLLVRDRWWFRALATLVLLPVVMMSLIFIAEAYHAGDIGEGALAFVGPLIAAWVAVPLTGMVKWAVSAARAAH
jgi:hypothetical protein